MDEPRNLTEPEIEDILNALDAGQLFNETIRHNIIASHRFNIRKQLMAGQIRPSKIEALKQRIIKQYYRALLKAGDHYALSSSHAVVQPIYQASMNAFHSAGSLIKTSDIIKLVSVIVNANKTIPFAFSTINVNRLFKDSELYMILRRDILEVKFRDIQIGSDIYNSGEGAEIIQAHSAYYTLIDWYQPKPQISTDDYLLHIKLDRTLLYIKYLTPYNIALKLVNHLITNKEQHPVYVFPSPATIEHPFIDIILPQKQAQDVINVLHRYSTNVGTDGILTLQLGSTFFNSILIPQIADLIISGVKGAHEVSVQKVNFGSIITNYQEIETGLFRCQFRRYHISNRMLNTEDVVKLYTSEYQKYSDPDLEAQGYDIYDIRIPENDPIKYLNSIPYVYGITKTNRRDKNELVSIDFADLIDYDYIDPYRCNSTNFYYIRNSLGINACNNNIVNSFQNIISEQSGNTYPQHAVLVATYICVLGDLFPYTFTGLSQHNIGFLTSAAFQNPLGAVISQSLGSQQPISSIDASIVAGGRPEIGKNYITYRKPKVGHEVNFGRIANELIGRQPKEAQAHPPLEKTTPETIEKTNSQSSSLISTTHQVGRIKPRGTRPPITGKAPIKPTAMNSISGESIYIPIQATQTNITDIKVSVYELMMNDKPVAMIPKGNLETLFSFWQI